MDKQETLKRVAEATLQQEIKIEVDINPTGRIHSQLQRWGIRPKKRVFFLRPIYLGSLVAISKILIGVKFRLPEAGEANHSLITTTYDAIVDHGPQLAEVVAIALHNRQEAPPKGLVKFIMGNFTNKELAHVLMLVIQKMEVADFMKSIISVKGLNVLESRNHVIAPGASKTEVSL